MSEIIWLRQTNGNTAHVKECLLSDIENTAEWRREKAVQYPDDERNQQCAESLDRLAAEVRVLADNHPLFLRLLHLWQVSLNPSEIILDSIARYGFDWEESGDAEEFLQRLIAAYDAETEDATPL
jgi:hypothetical protein